MTKEQLKEYYKRSNKTENEVLCRVIDTVDNLKIFGENNLQDVIKVRINQNKGMNILFLDAETPNKTEKGRNQKIEFLLVTADGHWVWIDAKHSGIIGNRITDTLYRQFDLTVNCKGEVWFYCVGKGYSDHVVQEYDKYIKNKGYQDKIKIIKGVINLN